MVRRKEFRSDLYYRLNVFPVVLPPLRERRQDIPQLVAHFVEVFARRMGKQITHIPQETLSALTSHPWPGNVRELQNLIERAVIRSDNGVLPNPLPTSHANPVVLTPRQGTFRDSQRAAILQTLQATGWVVGGPRGAAARLGLKRTTLTTKMRKLGITRSVRQNEFNELDQNCEREQFGGKQPLNEIPADPWRGRGDNEPLPHTTWRASEF
jgi:transcriptional regulator with GAF, ATPase, and Fis domain